MPDQSITFLLLQPNPNPAREGEDHWGNLRALCREIVQNPAGQPVLPTMLYQQGEPVLGWNLNQPLLALKAAGQILEEAALEGFNLRLALYLEKSPGDENPRVEIENNFSPFYGPGLGVSLAMLEAANFGQALLDGNLYEQIKQTPGLKLNFKGLGRWQLNEIAEPLEIYQLFPEGKTSGFKGLNAFNTLPNNLPGIAPNCQGRDELITELAARLAGENSPRLVTLLGPGGIGKSRLALAVATEFLNGADFKDGVFSLNLASYPYPEEFLPAVARTVEVKETAGKALDQSLKEFLAPRKLLLLLDNFERHSKQASLLKEFLEVAPGLKLLVTSRVALNLPGEFKKTIPPLKVPSLDETLAELPAIPELEAIGSVALFLKAAGRSSPNFKLTPKNAAQVARICVQLEGIPLAIELAAARIKLLPPEKLLAGLSNRLGMLTNGPRNVPGYQQTLRKTLEWHFELLDEQEKKLFPRLAVFAGGWTVEAAEKILDQTPGPSAPAGEIKTLLASLVGKSLIQIEDSLDRDEGQNPALTPQTRLAMLETVREFAAELFEAGRHNKTLLDRHALYYQELVETLEPDLVGPQQVTSFTRLGQEYPNIRKALRHFTEAAGQDAPAEAPRSFSLAGKLWRYWQLSGSLTEGLGWLEQTLQSHPEAGPDPGQALVLFGAGIMAREKGDYTLALEYLEKARDLQHTLGNRAGEAAALSAIAGVAGSQGNLERAGEGYLQSLKLREELNDRRGMAVALVGLAATRSAAREFPTVKEYSERALALLRQLEDFRGLGIALYNYAEALRGQGMYSEARTFLNESLSLREKLGDKIGLGHCYLALANISRDTETEDPEKVLKLYLKALKLIRQTPDNRYTAICFEDLALYLSANGGSLLAARLLGGAKTIRSQIGATPHPGENKALEGLEKNLQSRLTGPELDLALLEGEETPLEMLLEEVYNLTLTAPHPAT